ncbi:phage tail tape measure protein [Algoriphagus sp. D3-2-R+10]|uniref:phage tail tape measure protein n=1 Tax=Algoriphagus aurantiacus TaxID=3103948 RepID=UPI002B384416|nr:phage tail tape measure protein [Algoriphagus sp. D3-2-R+10]MEB2775235.1 phage tail tape measure protein [Algoriphagus sp. D3-2-R+10]
MAGKTIAYLNVLIGADSGRLNKALDSSEKAVKRFGGKLESIGKDLSLKVTAPLTAIGAISTQTAAKFSDSILKVKALSGATGAEFDQLENKAKELGVSTRYSASQVGDAMGFMALAGFNTNQTLAATPAILSLAAASATDLATASDIVTDTMSAFKIAANDANTVSDLFAKTQAKSNTNVLQLGEAFKYVAPNFAAANQSITDTSSLLAVLANSGIKGSMAGTALNAMLKDLVKNSKDGSIAVGNAAIALYDQDGTMRSVIDVMGDLEEATKGMNQMQKDAALGALFEERSIKAVNIMLNTGTKALRDYQGVLGDSTGAAGVMADEMESGLGGSLRKLYSSLEGIQIIIGDNLTPTINSFASVVQNVSTYLNGLDKSTQRNIVVAGLFAAAIPPITYALGAMVTMSVGVVAKLKVLNTMYAASTFAASSFGVALSASILPITAVVASLYALYKAGEYFNKSAEINKKVTAEIAVRTNNLNTIKAEAVKVSKGLNDKTAEFNKLSEKEKKAIIATTEAKIFDLETSIKQEKQLAQLTARKAAELTIWEQFTSHIFSFGNTTGAVYSMAQKSTEKYVSALGQQNVAIEQSESEVNNLKTSLLELKNTGNVTVEPVESIETLATASEKTKDILSKLKEELNKISINKDIDKDFNNVDARLSTFKQALIDLRLAGISPLSETYKQVEQDYNQAFDSTKLDALQTRLNELVNRNYTINLGTKADPINTNVGGQLNNEPFIASLQQKAQAIFDSNMTTANTQKAGNDLLLQQQTDFNNQFNGLVSGFAVDSIAGFAEGFGAMLVNGKSGIEQFGTQILGSMGKFLGQMGKLILAYGVSMEAFKKAFSNPYAAIAAGAVLIALGGAVSAMASKSSSIGSSGGGGVSSVGSGTSDTKFFSSRGIGSNQGKEAVEFVIKGDNLVGILDKNSRFKNRLIGG